MPEKAQQRDGAMNRRRLDLGMTWREVAAAAGISYETLRAVRKGDTAGGELTLSSIERALRWAPGAFAAVDAGQAPPVLSEADDPGSATGAGGPPPLEEDLALAQRLLASTVREMDLSPSEADEVWRRVRAEIEQSHAKDPGRPGRRRRWRAG